MKQIFKNIIKNLLNEAPPISDFVLPDQDSIYKTITDINQNKENIEEIEKELKLNIKDFQIKFKNSNLNFVLIIVTNFNLQNDFKRAKWDENHRKQDFISFDLNKLVDSFKEELLKKFPNKKIVLLHPNFYSENTFFSLQPDNIKHDLAHALMDDREERALSELIVNNLESNENSIKSYIINNQEIEEGKIAYYFFKSFEIESVGDIFDVIPDLMIQIIDKNLSENTYLSETIFNKFISFLKNDGFSFSNMDLVEKKFEYVFSIINSYINLLILKLKEDQVFALGINNKILNVTRMEQLFNQDELD